MRNMWTNHSVLEFAPETLQGSKSSKNAAYFSAGLSIAYSHLKSVLQRSSSRSIKTHFSLLCINIIAFEILQPRWGNFKLLNYLYLHLSIAVKAYQSFTFVNYFICKTADVLTTGLLVHKTATDAIPNLKQFKSHYNYDAAFHYLRSQLSWIS